MSDKKVEHTPKEIEQTYFLPDFGVSVAAISPQDAIKKAKEILK